MFASSPELIVGENLYSTIALSETQKDPLVHLIRLIIYS